MKKIFLSIFLLCLTIFVTACGGVATEPNSPTTPTTPTTTTPTTFESFCTTYNNIVKNDNNIAAEISSNKDCEFAGYSTKVVEESNGTLNLYGKVFNNSRSYCFYITMTYNNVELNNIFTQNKTKAEWYANLENFIKATNYDTCVENKVINFTEFNNAAKKYVPATTSEVMGSLNAVDIKALDEFYYDSEFNNYKFNLYTENIYTYTTTVDGKEQIVKNATIMKFKISLKTTDAEYTQNTNNITYYIDKFIECTQNPDAAWRLTQRVVSVIETEVNGADMGIELE